MKKRIIFINKNLKKFIKQFFLINDTPLKVAGGAAIGVFFGILPGEGLITTLAVTTILGFNRLSGSIAVTATNMWSTFLILPSAAFIGSKISGKEYVEMLSNINGYDLSLWDLITTKFFFKNVTIPLLIGFVVVCSFISLFIFFLIYLSLIIYSKRKKCKN